MLELKKVAVSEHNIDVHYRIEHWGNPTVVHDDSLVVSWWSTYEKPKYNASIHITDCEAETFDGSLEKLARWMERLAAGIRGRGKPNEQFSAMYTNKVEKMTHVSMGIEIPPYEEEQ